MGRASCLFCVLLSMGVAGAQIPDVQPQIVNKPELESNVTVVQVAAHFVTAIRMPEAVNSVVVGDPALFQVEHSDHEPMLVFVKALTTKPAETNLLISTTHGYEASVLLVSRGESQAHPSVDFLLKYRTSVGFLVEQTGYPSALIGETIPATEASGNAPVASPTSASPVGVTPVALSDPPAATTGPPDPPAVGTRRGGLDELLQRQEHAQLPVLYGEHVNGENASGDRIHVGVSEVMDGGQQVIVLFSVVNPQDRSILIVPPQVQVGGKTKSGK